LYGSNPNNNYAIGAIQNMEAAEIFFSGWICRFYVSNDTSKLITDQLKKMGAQVIVSDKYTFSRFLVADDATVDRYIIRDVDSRLNSRDR
jgi:hypothetical protein